MEIFKKEGTLMHRRKEGRDSKHKHHFWRFRCSHTPRHRLAAGMRGDEQIDSKEEL